VASRLSLASASDPLDAAKIRERLAPAVRDHVRSVGAHLVDASTNSVLLGAPTAQRNERGLLTNIRPQAVGGVGVRGWRRRAARSACRSAGRSAKCARDLGALSLVIGCARCGRAGTGVGRRRLKWPNDRCSASANSGAAHRAAAESAGPACVVIGID